MVEWASQLMPPNVGEVRKALRAEHPAWVNAAGAACAALRRRRRRSGALDGDLAVALDEDEEDVLAPQPGEQVRGGDAGVRVVGVDGRLEVLLVADRRLGLDLGDGDPGGAGRGDRGSRNELQRQRPGYRPDRAKERRAARTESRRWRAVNGAEVDRRRGDTPTSSASASPTTTSTTPVRRHRSSPAPRRWPGSDCPSRSPGRTGGRARHRSPCRGS